MAAKFRVKIYIIFISWLIAC